MSYQHIKVPAEGQKITVNADYSINVPDQPIVPYIEGDGTGVDISPVMIKVVDAAVKKPTKASAKYIGWKFTLVKNPPTFMALMSGCLKKLSKLLKITWCPSKAH